MFDHATIQAVTRDANRIGVEPAALIAVAEIESAGHVYANVAGRDEPLIRWEGHYFDRRLTGSKRALARKQGLASSTAGGVKNPSSQAARWQIVARASKIDKTAAMESFSIGLGQVMTAHWSKLGFSSPSEMVDHARKGAAEQINLMVRYVEEFGLVDELQRLDFEAFTRGYNGPGGIKAGYHTKMKAAYERRTGKPAVSDAAGMLRMGSTGPKVRELQALLLRAGYQVKVDGDYGPATKSAVMAFQTDHGIAVDGVVGPETQRAMTAIPRFEDDKPGAQSPTDVDGVKEGGGIAAGGGGAVIAADKINDIADKVAPTGTWIDYAVTGLYVVAGVLVVGGIGYAAYRYWQSRRNHTGDDDPITVDYARSPVDEAMA